MVDRCRVWESHADPAFLRISKPNPDPTYPAYAVSDADSDSEATRVAVVTEQRSGQNQLEDWLRWVISTAEPPAPKPEVPDVEKLLRSFLDGQRQRQWPPPPPPTRRDWSDVVCFSCGKSGHTATRCPNMDEAFPFLQPGWRTEKMSGGFVMIPPRVTPDHRRAENGGVSGRAGPPLGSVIMLGPRTQEGEQCRLFPHDGQYLMTFLRLWNSPGGGDLSWFPPGVRQCGPKRLRLRTLLDVSVLIMLLDYDRIRALCGC